MEFSKTEWLSIYSAETNQMVPKFDTNILANKIMGRVGCVVNINNYHYGNEKVTFRAYCGHKYKYGADSIKKCRKYKLHYYYESVNSKTDMVYLDFFHENIPILHVDRKTRELRGSDRANAQDKLKTARPEVFQRKVGTEIDPEFLEKHKNYQSYKFTAVYQKAAEERRHKDDNDKDVLMDVFFEIQNQKKKQRHAIFTFDQYVTICCVFIFEIAKQNIEESSEGCCSI